MMWGELYRFYDENVKIMRDETRTRDGRCGGWFVPKKQKATRVSSHIPT